MNLTAPTMPVFLVSLVIAVLAVISSFTTIPFITDNMFWTAIVAYVVLLVGNVAKGL